jgi:hypothetical protein
MPIAIVFKFSCTTEEKVCPLVCLCILLQLKCPSVSKKTFQGIWSKKESLLHINVLEMEAVMLSIKLFLPKLVGKNVLIRSDILTVVR